METGKFNRIMRWLHWIMAFGILGLITLGYVMKEAKLDRELRTELYLLHKSFGVMLLGLIVLRILVRLCSRVPLLPSGLSRPDRVLAKITHGLLYLGMVAVPLSGFIMSMAGGQGIKLFGYQLPEIMTTDKQLAGLAHEVHELLPYVLLGVIALHVAGALKHRFFDTPENDVLPRMGFPAKRPRQ